MFAHLTIAHWNARDISFNKEISLDRTNFDAKQCQSKLTQSYPFFDVVQFNKIEVD